MIELLDVVNGSINSNRMASSVAGMNDYQDLLYFCPFEGANLLSVSKENLLVSATVYPSSLTNMTALDVSNMAAIRKGSIVHCNPSTGRSRSIVSGDNWQSLTRLNGTTLLCTEYQPEGTPTYDCSVVDVEAKKLVHTYFDV